jgi:CO/xanthine dehydrogenase Mo-binding subunit
LAQAQAAAAAIVVELEPLPAVISMADALAPDAPLVHPQWQDY